VVVGLVRERREGRCLLGKGEKGHLDGAHGAEDGDGINHTNRFSIRVMRGYVYFGV
jgi:hypothetical protein